MKRFFVSLALFVSNVASSEAVEEGQELIGKPANEWVVSHWLNSRSLSFQNLRGTVLLIRWWTGPECSYCKASAPVLNKLYEEYRAQGLEVIGFYHHKSTAPLNPNEVEKLAKEFGFHFPIAIDDDWETLQNWWLKGHDRTFTSVSFLIDKEGIIRYIHAGGEYSKKDYLEMRDKIKTFLEKS
jgi:thiol-disulfide isomerase/thioredoxin